MISTLEANNLFCRYRSNCGMRSPFGGVFSRHDFQPKATTCEINVWGGVPTYGPYISNFGKVLSGKRFAARPYDFGQPGVYDWDVKGSIP